MQPQANLGNRQIYGKPVYDQTQIGRVVSTANYETYGRIEVVFLDYSKPSPVWVTGDIDRKPEEGDMVLVGFIQGRSDSPYLMGFVRNGCYTSNFIQVEKDKITVQFPTDATDIKGNLLDSSKKPSRVYIELTASGVTINGNVTVTGTVHASNIP